MDCRPRRTATRTLDPRPPIAVQVRALAAERLGRRGHRHVFVTRYDDVRQRLDPAHRKLGRVCPYRVSGRGTMHCDPGAVPGGGPREL